MLVTYTRGIDSFEFNVVGEYLPGSAGDWNNPPEGGDWDSIQIFYHDIDVTDIVSSKIREYCEEQLYEYGDDDDDTTYQEDLKVRQEDD